MAISIRLAQAGDEVTIFQLVRELAAYEDAADQVSITAAELKHEFDSQHPAFGCLLAEQGSTPVGFALFYYTFSTWAGRGIYLEDLYVLPAARGQGIGRRLITDLQALARAQGYTRIDWQVLDWNQSAQEFYLHIGATHRADWQCWRLDLK